MFFNRLRQLRTVLMVLFSFVTGAGLMHADPMYTFTQIDLPGAMDTFPQAINNVGQIAGTFSDATGFHGFSGSVSSFMRVDYPGNPEFTYINGINDAGQLAGSFEISYPQQPTSGFVKSGSSFTAINVPNASDTAATGINDVGQVVGNFFQAIDGGRAIEHGFVLSHSVLTQIDFPGASSTIVSGANNTGQIVGEFGSHGFVKYGSAFTQIDVPGAVYTEAVAINDLGEILLNTGVQGYLLSGSLLTQFNVPGSTYTQLNGINDAGQVVGIFGDANEVEHGFLATPAPEPTALTLVSLVLLASFCRLKIRSVSERRWSRRAE